MPRPVAAINLAPITDFCKPHHALSSTLRGDAERPHPVAMGIVKSKAGLVPDSCICAESTTVLYCTVHTFCAAAYATVSAIMHDLEFCGNNSTLHLHTWSDAVCRVELGTFRPSGFPKAARIPWSQWKYDQHIISSMGPAHRMASQPLLFCRPRKRS